MGLFSSRKSGESSGHHPHRSVVRAILNGIYSDQHRKFPSHSTPSKSSRSGMKQVPQSGSLYTTDFSRSSHALSRSLEQTNTNPCTVPRADADAITSTLAQRLNELAIANSEGLLNDDEYRLLRQNIFERLANNSPVPTEKPVIALSHNYSQPLLDTSSQFRVKTGRTPSVSSRASISSTFSRLFLFGTRRVSAVSKDGTFSETASTFSITPVASHTFKRRGIPRDFKGATFRPETPHNNISSPSREETECPGGLRSPSYRPTQSARLVSSPPSSFTTRCLKPKPSRSILASHPSQDDEAKSSQGIRSEIEAMEAEAMRVLDAFSGLELTVLTQTGQKHDFAQPRSLSVLQRKAEYNDSSLTAGGSTSGRGTPYHASDVDGSSLRSSASYGTSVSQPRSHRPNQSKSSGSLLPPLMANRKRSFSSLSSRARAPSISSPKLMHSQLRDLGSVSSLNLVRSLAPTSVTSVDEDSEFSVLEAELADIQRRRREVDARYQDRLEYLRAQLKGAELREKLLRK